MEPPLDSTNRQAPFVAPKGYFEELPGRIQQRITATPPAESRLSFFPQWMYYAVGSVIMLLVFVWLTLDTGVPPEDATPTATLSAEQLMAEVPEEAIITYLQASEVDVMETMPLTEAEQEVLLEQELSTYEVTEEYFNETNDDDLEDFL